MTNEQVFFIQCIADFILDRETEASFDSLNWKEIYNYSKSQQMQSIVYKQIKKCNVEDDTIKKLKADSVSSIVYLVNLQKNYQQIEERLLEKGIFFVQVKGFEIACLYPAIHYRTMGDIDLLIEQEDFDKITHIFMEQGFTIEKDTPFEMVFVKNQFRYEIHGQLVNGESDIAIKRRTFFGDYKKYMHEDESGSKVLDWNFHLLYLFEHIRQHILWQGVGFRQFTDIAMLIVRKGNDIDWDWVIKSIDAIELHDFFFTVIELLRRWFSIELPFETNKAIDNTFFEVVTEKMFRDGTFGFENYTNEINLMERQYSKGDKSLTRLKLSYLRPILFPSHLDLLKTGKYQYLRKCKLLTPVAWGMRGIKALKTRKSYVKRVLYASSVDKRTMIVRQEILKQWGL